MMYGKAPRLTFRILQQDRQLKILTWNFLTDEEFSHGVPNLGQPENPVNIKKQPKMIKEVHHSPTNRNWLT